METLQDYLTNQIDERRIRLYFDIETFAYNKQNGQHTPSEFKNMTYSVAVGWLYGSRVFVEVFQNFKDFFDEVEKGLSQSSKKPIIELVAHNSNKYDHHFLQKDITYYYPQVQIKNLHLTTADDDGNMNAVKIGDIKKKDKEALILEKRIKSSINLEMIFFINGIRYNTIDNLMKTNSSIDMLGKKLLKLGVLTEDELKTDFDYSEFDVQENMTVEQARRHAKDIFDNKLTPKHMTYIENDIIILAKSAYYYAEMFPGFNYEKITFTSNILEYYNNNDLTSFQLLNRFGEGKDRAEIKFTDYKFANENFYDYLKPFYRGGANFYNTRHLGTIIDTGVFGMDIHSSYPYAMYEFKIPTFFHSATSHDKPTVETIDYSNDNYFTMYRMTKLNFDTHVIMKIKSRVVRQLLVKYYTTNDFININDYTFKMITNITGYEFKELPILSKVTFETKRFGSYKEISEMYRVKTQGKQENLIDYKDPYDIKVTDQINEHVISEEEYQHSKVILNGLYGIPALRAYFNLFRLHNGEYRNVINGHKNNERNIVFSIFVTAVSLWNLTNPFKYLTPDEIDENFLYMDTDSLYFKQEIKHKLPDELFTDFSLGTWDLEHNNLPYFYVLHHKKYAYQNHKDEIVVKAGGIRNNSFDFNMPFKEFIDKQFSNGAEIETNKSIYNNEGTISIYPSKTKLKIGHGYRVFAHDEKLDRITKDMLETIRKQTEGDFDEMMYIESNLGSFSLNDLYPVTHEVKNKLPLFYLRGKIERIKDEIT